MASMSSQISFHSIESRTMSVASDDRSYTDTVSQHSFESTASTTARGARISVSR